MDERPAGALEVRLDALQQPAVAARTAVLLRQLRLALLAAVAGIACHLLGSHLLLRFADTSGLWPMVANISCVLAGLAAVLQYAVWSQAQAEWTGRKDVALAGLLAPSRLARWVALLCAVVAPVAVLQVVRDTSPQEVSHWLFAAGAVCTILAVGFGGMHPLDPAGPPGVLPRRVRRGPQVVSESPDPEADTLVLRREELGGASVRPAPEGGEQA
ncbi:hypothetical protein [Luteococcus peritonei]|uniref:Uncharacterized protein n=1 Tax=Luteococcus peritonei TaxID=88874 RepID=A0ABW4RZ34_9ACTN